MLDVHKRSLDRLAAMIDPAWQAHCRETCRKAFAFEPVDELPYVAADAPPADGEPPWPAYPYNDAFADPEKMLINELAKVHAAVRTRDYRPLNARPHYGTVIMPSMLGGPWQLTDNSLPWAHELPGGRDAVRALIDRGPADPSAGLGGRCLETADYYRAALSAWPPLAEAIDIYHPDLQGPYDVAHLLAGPDIFMAAFDEPELVAGLLEVVTETYRRFIVEWGRRVGFADADGMTTHWSYFIRGRIMLRNDTATLVGSEQYERFIQPYDGRLLAEFGGCIHFCGRGDQVHRAMFDTPAIAGLHSSQPQLNDCEQLLALAAERRVVLIGWPADRVPPGTRTGLTLSGRPPMY